MSTKHFRAAGFGVAGAILGALMAVWWVDRTRDPAASPSSPEGSEGEVPPDEAGERTPTPSPTGGPTVTHVPAGDGASDTGRPKEVSVPPLSQLSLQGATRGADRVLQLPAESAALTRYGNPVPWSGRLTDLVAGPSEVIAVHTDGKRSHLVALDGTNPMVEVPGGASGHSPFFVDDTLYWLRGKELVRRGPQGPEVVLEAPSLGYPAVSTDGFSLVIGKGLEFYDRRGSAQQRLDLPEPVQHGVWIGSELVFTRLAVGDADLWSFKQGALTPRVDSPQAELRPAADAEGVLWYVVEDTPGVYDLVRDQHVVAPDVGLSTRQGPSIRGTTAVLAAAEPGTLLVVSSTELTEVVTGLPAALDPVWFGQNLVFADGDALVVLQTEGLEGLSGGVDRSN